MFYARKLSSPCGYMFRLVQLQTWHPTPKTPFLLHPGIGLLVDEQDHVDKCRGVGSSTHCGVTRKKWVNVKLSYLLYIRVDVCVCVSVCLCVRYTRPRS